MPEFYSSNVNQFSSSENTENDQKFEQKRILNSSKVFYILKNDQISIVSKSASLKKNELGNSKESIESIDQNSIRDQLLKLLTEHPQNFLSLSLPDTFNCTNKQKGLHRDPFDCTKYYYCLDNTGNEEFFEFFGKKNTALSTDLIQTKVYMCPKDTIFNMNGCFCDRGLGKEVNCTYLSESFCDISQQRQLKKTFA